MPLTYTFNSSSVSARVVAPNYPETSIKFNINNALDVRAAPNIVDLNSTRPTNITIFASSPVTGQPIEGKILTNEDRGGITKEIGSTNTAFSHKFESHVEGNPRRGFHHSAPDVIVVAPTYDNSPVPIEFINVLQPERIVDNGEPDNGGDGNGCDARLTPEELRPTCELMQTRQLIMEGVFSEAFSRLTRAEEQISAL
jgi:hypothetical protein